MSIANRALRSIAAVTIAVAGLGLLWLVYLGLTWDMRRAGEDVSARYRVVPIERGDLSETVVATGAMEPLARVIVQSEIPGIVEVVRIDDGDRISRGQPLLELDRTRLEDQAAELRASLALQRARARVNLVGRAQAELEKTESDHARFERLHRKGVASREQMDEIGHALRLARIALTDARAERAARHASVDRAAKALQRVERDLEKSIIRSPIDGIVIRRQVEVGAAVADLQNGGTVVAILADDSRVHLLGQVDENDIAGVREGQSAEVQIDAFAGEVFPGRVRKIASSGTAEGGVSSFQVEVELERDPRIRVGMSADARIAVKHHREVLLVPNTAILRDQSGPRVRLVDVAGGNGFALRPIQELYSDGFQTAISGGLAEGDRVMVRSAELSP
jgi:HlyD family secretion protein